jgi:hypothetical protein
LTNYVNPLINKIVRRIEIKVETKSRILHLEALIKTTYETESALNPKNLNDKNAEIHWVLEVCYD